MRKTGVRSVKAVHDKNRETRAKFVKTMIRLEHIWWRLKHVRWRLELPW